MQNPKLFAVLSFVLLGATMISLVMHMLEAQPSTAAVPVDTWKTDFSEDELHSQTGFASELAAMDASLLTGMQTVAPAIESIPKVTGIPWSDREVMNAFHSSTAKECKLLVAGTEVYHQLLPIRPQATGPIGRLPALTVSLQMDLTAKRRLPELSKDAIERYLSDHLLAIEPTLYFNETGQPYFGDEVRAAFFKKTDPRRTIEPEAMIGQAIGSFRTFGLYVPPDVDPATYHPRTLVMAFRYTSIDPSLRTQVSEPKKEFELLFLHLLPTSSGAAPKVVVFATSDGRKRLQELDTAGMMQSLTPSVTAAIRFEDFKVMGLMPTNPVVMGVHHHARLSVPVDTIRLRLEGVGSEDATRLPELLDELHMSAASNLSPLSSGSSLLSP